MLPNDLDLKAIMDRPGDEVYEKIKHYIPKIVEDSDSLAKELVNLFLKDQIHDLALVKALDKIGEIIEYHAQNEDVMTPEFSGEKIMEEVSKLSLVRFMSSYCELLGLAPELKAQILTAVIAKTWAEPKTKHQIVNLMDKGTKTPSPNPEPYRAHEVKNERSGAASRASKTTAKKPGS